MRFLLALALALLAHAASAALLIAHRGDPAFAPGASQGSYAAALAQGARALECDLVLTSDMQLLVAHSLDLRADTNAGERLADRAETRHAFVSGSMEDVHGSVLASNVTLHEAETLLRRRAAVKDPLMRDQSLNDVFPLLSLETFLQYVLERSAALGEEIVIVPEVKEYAFHEQRCIEENRAPTCMLDMLLDALDAHGFLEQPGRVIVQSFQPHPLRILHERRADIPLMQLVHGACCTVNGTFQSHLLTPRGMDDVAAYATYFGVSAAFYFDDGPAGQWPPGTLSRNNISTDEPGRQLDLAALGGLLHKDALLEAIQSRGMRAVVYTMRDEDATVQTHFAGNPAAAARHFLASGVDALFVEHFARALRVQEDLAAEMDDDDARDDDARDGGRAHCPTSVSAIILLLLVIAAVPAAIAGLVLHRRRTRRAADPPETELDRIPLAAS